MKTTYTKKQFTDGLITEVTVIPIKSEKHPHLRAKVNFVLCGAFKGYLGYVVSGQNGLFPAFAQKKEYGKYFEVMHPVTDKARIEFHDKVMQVYDEATQQLSLDL